METELKFQVPAASAARLKAAVATACAQRTRLQAVYAETRGMHLAAAGLALRLRKEGRMWVQTLKGRGDGLMSRLEHEVPLPAQRGVPVLDLQRHAGTEAGARLAAAMPTGTVLQPLYRTDIQRLHRRVRSAGAVVELAYDVGWLYADGDASAPPRRLAVREIEFELIRGPAVALPDLALRWTLRHGLWWDSRTKSERGMRLALGIDSVPATLALPAARGPRGNSLARCRSRVVASLAHVLPNAVEIASGLGSLEHGEQVQRGFKSLRAALQQAVKQAPDSAAAAAEAAAAQALLDGEWPTTGPMFQGDDFCSPAAQRLLLGSLRWTLDAR